MKLYFESYDPIEDQDSTIIGNLNPGDTFRNRSEVVVTILEPTKDGRIQYKTSITDGVKVGSERSIRNMLYQNNFMRDI